MLILGGTGKSFSSGDDRTDERTMSAPYSAPFNQGRYPYHQLQTLLRRIPQPVIAEVHGYCMGSGFDLMLASDFAIADPDSKLRLVITATAFLPKYVGLKHAWRLILDDGFTSAQEAADLGLITKVAAPGALAEEVNALAERLAEIGPHPTRLPRRPQGVAQPLLPSRARRRPAHATDRQPHEGSLRAASTRGRLGGC